jgi:hypothetical protein
MSNLNVHHKCDHGIVLCSNQPRTDAQIVVTTVDDIRLTMRPVWEFHNAVHDARKLADMKRETPVVVKVESWPFVDLCWSLGIDPRSLDISRYEVEAALKTVMLESQDPFERRQAFDELVKMEVIL